MLCRATDDGCCAGNEATSGTPDEQRTPTPSNDAANCICGGAIKATDNRVQGHGSGSLSPTPDMPLSDSFWLYHSPLTLQHVRGGLPPEEDRWPGSRRVHALFQHFRC
jgi:hypothetical protein